MNTTRKLVISIIVWIGICYGFLAYELYKGPIMVNYNSNSREINVCAEDSFTIKDFVLELHIQEVKFPDIILRQAALESGWFTSMAWKKNNNPFGFVGKDGYIMFNDWRSAVAYMKDWQDKNYHGGDYYRFLEDLPYASDTNYIETLKAMDMNNLKQIK